MGKIAYTCNRRHRAIAEENIRCAGYDTDFTPEVYAHLGGMLAECFRLPLITPHNFQHAARVEGWEHYQQARHNAGRVILVTAHLGNWEKLALLHSLHAQVGFDIVGRKLDNDGADRFVREMRGQAGSVIDKQNGLRQMLKSLRSGHDLGILIDQALHPDQAVPVQFFGRPVTAVPVVTLLAQKTGAAVVCCFIGREPDGTELVTYCPPTRITGDQQRDSQELTTIIEAFIRRYKEQWFWVHRRWKHSQELSEQEMQP